MIEKKEKKERTVPVSLQPRSGWLLQPSIKLDNTMTREKYSESCQMFFLSAGARKCALDSDLPLTFFGSLRFPWKHGRMDTFFCDIVSEDLTIQLSYSRLDLFCFLQYCMWVFNTEQPLLKRSCGRSQRPPILTEFSMILPQSH